MSDVLTWRVATHLLTEHGNRSGEGDNIMVSAGDHGTGGGGTRTTTTDDTTTVRTRSVCIAALSNKY